jgi:hypothetical protein
VTKPTKEKKTASTKEQKRVCLSVCVCVCVLMGGIVSTQEERNDKRHSRGEEEEKKIAR